VISQLAVGAAPMHLDTTSIALACEARSACVPRVRACVRVCVRVCVETKMYMFMCDA
jgi:hypothetical protein